jgi:hypothetical protein
MQSFTFRDGTPHEHLFLGYCFVELTIGHSARRLDNFVLRYPVCESVRIRLISIGRSRNDGVMLDRRGGVGRLRHGDTLLATVCSHYFTGQPTHGEGNKPRTGAWTYNAHFNGFSRLLEEIATFDDPLTSGP